MSSLKRLLNQDLNDGPEQRFYGERASRKELLQGDPADK